MPVPARIVDAHVHLYDIQQNRHRFLEKTDPGYEAFVGNYNSLPRRYLLDDYLADTHGYPVDAIVWHEFLSDEPWREAAWAQQRADAGGLRHALVAKVDFLDPALEAALERYADLRNVTAVREHLVWDDSHPLKRFAKRPDLMRDPAWRRKLRVLERHQFKCGLEVFSSQLGDLIEVIHQYPNIGFTIAVMGWPIDTTWPGFERWRCDITSVARCGNVCMDISALECVFGMQWAWDDAQPWIRTAIECFGPSRCMLGSHLPIAKLSTGFGELYRRYEQITEGCSADEIDELFYGVANRWFRPA
ncbi:amidohydrolase [Dyella sp. C9]|uniref:amidohydrolase family protein n=1 Tax=Dyella sp. C9 TaxID=2202154 RepID=UPI000DF01DBA|nr:amidohydrolase family protein [Dyella sp. C9]